MRYFSRILIKSIYKFIINRRIPYPWINRYSTNYYLLVFYKIPSIDIWAHVSHIWNRKSCMQRQYAHALCIRTHSSYDTSYNPHFLSYVTILAALATSIIDLDSLDISAALKREEGGRGRVTNFSSLSKWSFALRLLSRSRGRARRKVGERWKE